MKKILILWIALLLLLSSSAYAASNEGTQQLGFAATIAGNYIKWADIYHIPDINMEYYYSPDATEDNLKTLFVDELGIIYNNADLEATWVSLFYFSDKTSSSYMANQWKRASALIGAIVFGDPWEYSSGKMSSVTSEIDEIMFNLIKTQRDFQNTLMDGGTISFYLGDRVNMYLQYIKDDKQFLITAY